MGRTDRWQRRWTRQLLHGSAPLPRPSPLKIASLPLASGASLHLAFYARLRRRPLTFICHLARLHVGCALIRNRSLANIILPSNVWGFERMFKCYYIRSGPSFIHTKCQTWLQRSAVVANFSLFVASFKVKSSFCFTSPTLPKIMRWGV